MNDSFIIFLNKNKEELLRYFEDTRADIIPDIVSGYGSFEEEREEYGEEGGFEYNEWDWYDDYSHTTGYQAEWDAAEHVIGELLPSIENSEEQQGYLIEFLGYSTSYGGNSYYKED